MRGKFVDDRFRSSPARSPPASADRSFQSPIATVPGGGSVQHGLSAAGTSRPARAFAERQINAIRYVKADAQRPIYPVAAVPLRGTSPTAGAARRQARNERAT